MESLAFPSHEDSNTFPTSLPPYVGAVLFETFLYGLYVILFAICIYVLLRHHRSSHGVLLASAVLMFALATTDIIYTYYILFAKLLKGGLSFMDVRPKYWLHVTNSVLADSLLIYRCFVVWEHKKSVVIGPIILLLAATACGYVFEGSSTRMFNNAYIYLVMSFALNAIVTVLTAGRIWWLARKAQVILGARVIERYNSTIAVLIESGFLYSLYTILDLAVRNTRVVNTIVDAGLIHVVGIMPTLIIVQVGLGRSAHDIETTHEAMVFANAETMNNRKSASIVNTRKSYSENMNTHSVRGLRESQIHLQSQCHYRDSSTEMFVVQSV
ncbi:hypothetical protein CPB84DRAFT_1846969 [Gymnopilus junonius]|uniref:Uncharacterized protein n=1 Tax=Gymnopilus junonius TaxID=109634 RepID=A0A9P5TMK5_GYMJU|nr:hypothetical protein CPB84DRAFT_1846969 [Gymnopilus junonius]